ncbi:hypothetical protein [Nitrososphaera sp.]|uniref:hypothetical protein n=1 Tax=Nitrososphaera sp. TaxID=1971748 RepID=UPI00307F5421
MRSKYAITSAIIAIGIMLGATMANSQAFAANPYVAGYPDRTTISKENQFTQKTDFSGTTTSTRNTDITSVFSAATFASSTATDTTSWIHQQGIALLAANAIRGVYQVWNGLNCQYNCSGTGPSLGNHGTASADIDYVYSTFAFESPSRTRTWQYYEPHTNGGSIVSIPIQYYTMSTYGDPAQYFASGAEYKNIQVGNPPTWVAKKMKYFQFAVEGNGAELTSTWTVKQYEIWSSSIGYLSTVPVKSTAPSTDSANGAYITRYTASDGTIGGVQIADTDYTTAGANYNLKSSSIPAGTVIWQRDTVNHITAGTQLWN